MMENEKQMRNIESIGENERQKESKENKDRTLTTNHVRKR